jgi:hypothetical protein
VSDLSSAARDIIAFVLGMARSGSSATTRILSLCGGRLPESLLPPNRSNPTGYWEPSSAVQVNARFLRASGSSFFDTQLVQEVPEDDLLGRELVAEITEQLQAYRGAASDAPLILKEPRISILLPFWLAAVERTKFSPRVVIPVRHPSEVASSLGAWKGVSEAHTAELWLKYNLLAERHTRHLPRAFVSYARLLADWRREVLSISEALGLALTLNDEVDQFLSPELRHTVSEDEEVSSETPWLREVYRALSTACRTGSLDVDLLDAAFLDLSKAQGTGSLLVVRSFGTDFGVP